MAQRHLSERTRCPRAAEQLMRVPYEVVLSERLRARLAEWTLAGGRPPWSSAMKPGDVAAELRGAR